MLKDCAAGEITRPMGRSPRFESESRRFSYSKSARHLYLVEVRPGIRFADHSGGFAGVRSGRIHERTDNESGW